MIDRTSIIAVRVWGADGIHDERPWDQAICHLVRDDHPYLDILTRGYPAQADKDTKLSRLPDPCGEGMQWQRWDLTDQMSWERRLGEVTAALKVPKGGTLRCYVIPTALISYRDVIAMAQDIEAEIGFAAVWDMQTKRPERTWSRALASPRSNTPSEIVDLLEEEVSAATLVRQNPFTELGPRSTAGVPLAENAIVSHWATRRLLQVTEQADAVGFALSSATMRSGLTHPANRQTNIDEERNRLNAISQQLDDARLVLARFVDVAELAIQIHPSPLLQRDHRLRTLLRAFATSPSEALSETDSARSHFPAISLNRLWELWGIVWVAQELRRLGFTGWCSVEAIDAVKRCSWRLSNGDVLIELDFEAEPTFIDYEIIPPAHERDMPAMEWAACNQVLNIERPFLGSELKCSPDYLVRITTPTSKVLLVGDACLATPGHHGRNDGGTNSKTYTVEKYRRTIGWVAEDQVVRCHPMGGFVVFPPPANAWVHLERVPGASDCTILCPHPQGDPEASRRLRALLKAVVPGCEISDAG